MLAALGLSVQPVFHLPDPVFDSTLGTLSIHSPHNWLYSNGCPYFSGYGVVTKLFAERPEAVWQILLALAAIETFSLFKNGQGSAGDLGFDPLNLQVQLNI